MSTINMFTSRRMVLTAHSTLKEFAYQTVDDPVGVSWVERRFLTYAVSISATGASAIEEV